MRSTRSISRAAPRRAETSSGAVKEATCPAAVTIWTTPKADRAIGSKVGRGEGRAAPGPPAREVRADWWERHRAKSAATGSAASAAAVGERGAPTAGIRGGAAKRGSWDVGGPWAAVVGAGRVAGRGGCAGGGKERVCIALACGAATASAGVPTDSCCSLGGRGGADG
eukprot:scaffold19433_cov112-Isochrysis_galbana.AAC.4